MQVVASETIELPRATASAHAWQAPASSSSPSLSGPAGALEEGGTGIAGPHRNGTLLRVLEGKMIISIRFSIIQRKGLSNLSVCVSNAVFEDLRI